MIDEELREDEAWSIAQRVYAEANRTDPPQRQILMTPRELVRFALAFAQPASQISAAPTPSSQPGEGVETQLFAELGRRMLEMTTTVHFPAMDLAEAVGVIPELWEDCVKERDVLRARLRAAPVAPIPAQPDLHRVILEALEGYRCQHHQQYEDNGGLPLADVLSPPGAANVGGGNEEIQLLADEIFTAIEDAAAPQAAQPSRPKATGLHICPRHDYDIVSDPVAGCPKCNAEKSAAPVAPIPTPSSQIARDAAERQPLTTEQPPYPEGDVIANCVCGSWPGGKCLKCKWIPAERQPLPPQSKDRSQSELPAQNESVVPIPRTAGLIPLEPLPVRYQRYCSCLNCPAVPSQPSA